VHYGDARSDDADVRELFRDHIVALGTRRFAAEHSIHSVDDLLRVPLVHLSGEDTGWTTWADWFAALDRPAPKGRKFHVNNYMIALQAAQDDVGAVLGWDGLVENLMQDGRLVRLVPESMPSPMAFYLKVHPKASPKARLFADWLAESA